MIAHVVLMKPRPDLPDNQRRAFVELFETAVRAIPHLTGVRVGRRIRTGAAYDQLSPDSGDYVAFIEFEDRAGLDAYLRHPAHAELGSRFYQVLSAAQVYDYEIGGLEMLRDL